METAQDKAYEALYYSLWELAQRYSEFTQFRVIGKSHDERLIPMLEIGHGESCIFSIWRKIGLRTALYPLRKIS